MHRTFSKEDVEAALMKPKSWWAIIAILPATRRISKFLANKTNISPNQITIFSFFLCLVSAYFFYKYTPTTLIIGAVIYQLSYLFDCVDGTIARLKGLGNVFGDVLDHVLDRWRMFFNIIALSFGYFRSSGDSQILMLCAIYIFVNMVYFYYTYTFHRISSALQQKTGESIVSSPSQSKKANIFRRYVNFMNSREYFVIPGDVETEAIVFFFGPIIGSIKLFLLVATILITCLGFFRISRFLSKAVEMMKRKYQKIKIMKKLNVQVYSVILGGGHGKRFGDNIPKQFALIGNKPVLIHTLQKFDNHPEIKGILIIMHEQWIDQTIKLLDDFGIKKVMMIRPGGATRQESSYKAMQYLQELCADEDIVVVHDAVRPFIDHKIISESIRITKKHGASDVVIPATDTIVQAGGRFKGFIHRIPTRDSLYRGQTPQTFRYGIFKYCHIKAKEENYTNVTDDVGLILRYGFPTKLVEGSISNIKITNKTDLSIAEVLLRLNDS